MHSSRSLRLRIAALALVALVSADSVYAELGFTPLGDLPGGSVNSVASAISADGTTIVGKSASANGNVEAFRWTAATGMVALGDLPGGNFASEARAVSSDGSVVVGLGGAASGFNGGWRWTAAAGLVALPDLAGGVENGYAAGVSADGLTAVGYGTNPNGEATRWSGTAAPTGLGYFSGGNSSEALGISGDGSVIVGKATRANGFTAAFRWTASGGMEDLGFLPGGDSSYANAASADGSVVVGRSFIANFGRRAFRWTAATGLVDLGVLGPTGTRSEAFACSADGSVVVGYSEGGAAGDSAFIWDSVNGMRSLRSLLTAAGLASGWRIEFATGVSADGKRITGTGTNKSGNTEAFLIDFDAPPPPPPPPATVALVWTESGPQPGPGLPGPSILRLGYDNGTIGPDLATHSGASGGGFNGVEYANGLILVANQGTGGTRVQDPRYSPIIVSNVVGYDLDATPGFIWQATGGGNTLIKGNTFATLTGTGVHDRTYGTAASQLGLVSSPGFFTNALQVVGDLVYFSSSTTSPVGLHVFNPTDSTTAPVHTAGAPSIYDFEVVGNQIYFGNIANNTIQRVNLDGTGLVTLVTGATFPNGIDVTDTHIYWSEFTTGLIRRANLDGTNPVTLIEDRSGLRGLAVLPLSVTTGPAPQALSITGLSNLPFRYTGAINTPVPLTPASTSGLPVSLEIVSGPATVSDNAITYTGTGVVVVRATQAGDASFAPATFTTSVNAAPRLGQTITFPELPNLVYTGTPLTFTLSATASSGLTVGYFITAGSTIATRNTATNVVTITGTGTVTIRATQSGDATYATAPFVERTFTVTDTAVVNPLASYLEAAGIAANQRGPLDDPDGDGLANLLEFALGLTPGIANPDGAPDVAIAGNLLTLTYTRAQASGLTYEVETTTDLVTWTTAGVTQGTPDANHIVTATIALDVPGRFLRLKVSLTPTP